MNAAGDGNCIELDSQESTAAPVEAERQENRPRSARLLARKRWPATCVSIAVAMQASANVTGNPPLAPIYSYEPPVQLASNLWQVTGSLKHPVVPRNMTVYRLGDGRLVLYSVVAMHEAGMRALEALGTPAFMVMPHDRHQMDAPFYRQRYPSLRVLAPDPSAPRNVPVDGGLDELTTFGIKAYPLPGTTYHEVILELPIDTGIALCACELLGNISGAHGLMGLLMKLLGPPGGGFGVSRVVRLREVSDRKAVHGWLAGLVARGDIRVLLVGHGAPITGDAHGALAHATAGA
jgi:hypothetical protein